LLVETLIDRNRSIEALLPRYYETHGENPTYATERMMIIDGHEVAWMKYDGHVKFDISRKGREGEPYTGHSLYCSCHFTEGVGWRVDDKYGVVGLMDGDKCIPKETAIRMRNLELRDEYKEKFERSGLCKIWDIDCGNPDVIKAVIKDLIDKGKAEEFLEGSDGAQFYGGYYYLQTVGKILGIDMRLVWDVAREMVDNKQISIDGAVVQTYREPYKAKVYSNEDDVPEAVFYYEKPDKVWALVPRPEADIDLNGIAITDENLLHTLGSCIVGLAHTPDLAKARLQEAVVNPRLSHERLYQRSFIESGYKAGALAVLAFTARTSDQQEEWVVEGFVGDEVKPTVHILPMYHQTTWGIDIEDSYNLDSKTEEWWPANS
ncbi:MAG: hypothetical protein Q7T41_03580, partial [Candidatus Saccharibacteria bacterium]|nr:hypothetical protein [Candidatus Saccharibacteria bacterium]